MPQGISPWEQVSHSPCVRFASQYYGYSSAPKLALDIYICTAESSHGTIGPLGQSLPKVQGASHCGELTAQSAHHSLGLAHQGISHNLLHRHL